MNPIRKLFGQTAVYGLGTVVPRLLNYLLLTPFFTRVFTKGEYGVVTELYAYVVFLMIILTYGMETGFFRFAGNKDQKNVFVFGTSLISLTCTSLAFIISVILFRGQISEMLGYGGHPEYILWLSLIVGIDVICTIPFARLRWENRALRFASIKVISVIMNIGLNFLLLYFIPRHENRASSDIIQLLYRPEIGVGYVFIANLASSLLSLILLLPVILKIRIKLDLTILKRMLKYAYPLLLAGLAGTVNEALDRILLKHLLPETGTALSELGVYGANYKIAVLMTLFVQMFRYASEPFYFSQAGQPGARQLFAGVMKYFVIAALLIFLLVTLHIDLFKYFIGSAFHEGLHIVPIVLMANLLLGIFFNLSIWYKLKNLTKYGALITLMGAGVTIAINIIFIPVCGYTASAWAHLVCYASMVLVSWRLGRRHYPVQYDLKAIGSYLVGALLLYGISVWIDLADPVMDTAINTALFAGFVIIVILLEKKNIARLNQLK